MPGFRAVHVVDAAVVGAGSIGAMALWHLTRRRAEGGGPLRVLGIEQFGTVHTRGAFSGESRLFRVAAKEGRLFVPALMEARSQWLELGRLTGRDLLIPSGVLHVAPGGHTDFAETFAAINEYGLPYRHLDANELRNQYPQFAIYDGDEGILDELAGAIRPESAVFAASRQAQRSGAQILYNTQVTAIEPNGSGVRLMTSAGVVEAGRVIVTAGPWVAGLVHEVRQLVSIGSYTLTWFMPEDIGLFHHSRFPGFMRDLDDVHAFGAPTFDGYSVKVSPHLLLPEVDDIDDMSRTVTREQLRWMGAQAQRMFPTLDPEPVRWSVHPDSHSADRRPLIDVFDDGRIVVAAGMSGNGFKFAPVWGEAVADLALTGVSQWQQPEFKMDHHRAGA